jgi:hypothetical protein
MNRSQNRRWKRKAIVLAASAGSFVGLAAVGDGTVSAGNYGQCSEADPFAVIGSNDDVCVVTEDTVPTDDSVPSDTVPDTVPEDTTPEDTTPEDTTPEDTTPDETVPVTTDPATQQLAPTTVKAAIPAATPAPAADPVQEALPQTATPNVLPVTGRGSALPTLFIAVGLLGAGSVALAFARRGAATREAGQS